MVVEIRQKVMGVASMLVVEDEAEAGVRLGEQEVGRLWWWQTTSARRAVATGGGATGRGGWDGAGVGVASAGGRLDEQGGRHDKQGGRPGA